MKQRVSIVILAAGIVVLPPFFGAEAQAYIDPGSGSYVLQLLIAFLVGALFAVKQYWRRVVDYFRGKSSPNEDE